MVDAPSALLPPLEVPSPVVFQPRFVGSLISAGVYNYVIHAHLALDDVRVYCASLCAQMQIDDLGFDPNLLNLMDSVKDTTLFAADDAQQQVRDEQQPSTVTRDVNLTSTDVLQSNM